MGARGPAPAQLTGLLPVDSDVNLDMHRHGINVQRLGLSQRPSADVP
jgi:hypothetical protein